MLRSRAAMAGAILLVGMMSLVGFFGAAHASMSTSTYLDASSIGGGFEYTSGGNALVIGPDGHLYAVVGTTIPTTSSQIIRADAGSQRPISATSVVTDAATGVVNDWLGSVAFDGAGNLYTIGTDGHVWEQPVGSPGTLVDYADFSSLSTSSGLVVANGYIYVSDNDFMGDIWRVPTGATTSLPLAAQDWATGLGTSGVNSMAMDGTDLIAAANDSSLFRLDTSQGSIAGPSPWMTSGQLPPQLRSQVATDSVGNVYFASSHALYMIPVGTTSYELLADNIDPSGDGLGSLVVSGGSVFVVAGGPQGQAPQVVLELTGIVPTTTSTTSPSTTSTPPTTGSPSTTAPGTTTTGPGGLAITGAPLLLSAALGLLSIATGVVLRKTRRHA